MPCICAYQALTYDTFLCVTIDEATGIEKMANVCLAPTQYLLAGRVATRREDGHWTFSQRFDYNDYFYVKTASSIFALPASLALGSTLKAVSYLSKEKRDRYLSLKDPAPLRSNLALYEQWGLPVTEPAKAFICQGYARRPESVEYKRIEKEALNAVASALNEANIPWWVDRGTCMGTYRYGGIIPWDLDLDIAILTTDFENAQSALAKLDPEKYAVRDWSSREHPHSSMKVYIRETTSWIDIYCHKVDPANKQMTVIFSLENNIFFTQACKIYESRYVVPQEFSTVFPLRKANFDGVAVFIPNNPEKYLQKYYGENLAPPRVYDPISQTYEKDLTHPYWQRSHVY
jgi:phosphorylcholine metabolism protein LicD